jgi:release factor glutamine methyltransferase
LEFSGPRHLKALFDRGRDTLKEAGIEDYEISAEILLRHIVGLTRAEFLTNPHMEPEEDKIELYVNHIGRRARREPIQYITGETEFYNVTIKCDPRALIPRPETEVLVEAVIARMDTDRPARILDIGTGSGNIAIALVRNIGGSRVTGIDVSGEAIELARINAEFTGTAKYLNFMVTDILDDKAVKSLGKFDCVVSNPPYVSPDQKDLLQPEVTQHEPEVALFTSEDALAFYRRIVSSSEILLRSKALLAFEVGLGQADDVRALMTGRFGDIEVIEDLAGIARVVIGRFVG